MAELALSDVVLFAACVIVSFVNASIGPTGAGTFAAMAAFLPAQAVVPVHGFTESLSCAARWMLLRQYVDWHYVRIFSASTAVGLCIAWPILAQGLVSEAALKVLIGAFIILITWIPLNLIVAEHPTYPAFGGAVTGFLTLFVGATALIVTAMIAQRHRDHRKVLATAAACMAIQHGVKIPLFIIIGFSYGPYMRLLMLLFLATLLGTWVGSHLLLKLDKNLVRCAFRLVITLIAIKMMTDGIYPWISSIEASTAK